MCKNCFLFFVMLIAGCAPAPKDTPVVVDDFHLERFLGTWHEIVRTDNVFQRNVDRVSANYSVEEDGYITVVNKAYDVKIHRWRVRTGRAMLAGRRDKGALKMSFYGNFYSQCNIVALDMEHYSWALLCGRDKSMFWIVSRRPEIDPALLKRLLAKADSLGFDTSKLLYAGYGSKR
ncbi:MAG: lipocalin family protein [Chlorobium sp.]|uniref:lipocalin family protein n=1 Tax=Chlorobium sp. TaxID=1095 RepID=UPI0025B806E2|nr:lipocalin family protein [Chlorobium sp.]MCF8383525.1 lipocalin family protein [Chlorobium sp.]